MSYKLHLVGETNFFSLSFPYNFVTPISLMLYRENQKSVPSISGLMMEVPSVKSVGLAAIRHTAANSESFLDADNVEK